jgi:predicted aldo/keto reductase-like oxidoreductase
VNEATRRARHRNEQAPMQYRRFGRTNLALSAITLGGMRYHDVWTPPRDEIPKQTLDQCCQSVLAALDAGINHIETAHGYGKSEHCYGRALNVELQIPRDRYFLMTKGAPATADEAKRLVDEQLQALRTDFIDLYAWHGVNTHQLFETATARGGPVEALHRLRDEGVIGCVGFSSHAPLRTICAAIETDLFDFVNLHYYYFWQRNWGAIQVAAAHDMGVFIISPNDKGGNLFNPPRLLSDLTAPLTPIQFNARFCLSSPLVHTLSFGMNEPAHFDEMRGIFPVTIPLSERDQGIVQALDARLAVDRWAAYHGYELEGDPSGINIPEVLRFRRMLKCYDMLDFGVYRYNMFSPTSHWFNGEFATAENIAKIDLTRVPDEIPLAELLAETHAALYRPKTS